MSTQFGLDLPVQFTPDAYNYGSRSDGGTHGLVLTKSHVVDLILDLVGYRQDSDLTTLKLLEPACGHGAFVVAAVERLLASATVRGIHIDELRESVCAFDIDPKNVDVTRQRVIDVLLDRGIAAAAARSVAEHWVQRADFLLRPMPVHFDVIVGNPPYIRIEQLSAELLGEYRRRYETLFDRADLYVAFIERSLRLLVPGGVLSLICANRWTLNKYGAPLRRLVSSEFAVRTYIDLHHANPFESEVAAYPSIFVIGRESPGLPVRVVALSHATPDECHAARDFYIGKPASHDGVSTSIYSKWFANDDPWILSSPEQLATLRDLEAKFPILEESGKTSVRIGIATGSDSTYIVPSDADIEPDRLVPLIMRGDIGDGSIRDARRSVINTYAEKGTIELSDYPRLKKYLQEHEPVLRKRHIAQKGGGAWFRTIDRPYPELVAKPKLLIPDIAGSNDVIYEAGRFYPHHNLYFIVSDEWDLEVLGGLLSSRVALFFVWSYAVKMRGGYLRFQAQYLRRIRVPPPRAINGVLQRDIKTAFRQRDFPALDALAASAYGLAKIPDFDFVDVRS